MSKIEFWLKDRDNNYLRLPVNPESIEITSSHGVNTVGVASLGEVSIPGEQELKRTSFSSFFPKIYNASYCEYSGFPAPKTWVTQIEKWRDSRHGIRLVVTGTSINIPVLISDFTTDIERAGNPGDIYFTISFIEYKEPNVKIVKKVKKVVPTKPKAKPKPKRPSAKKSKSKTYTVVRGDCLWNIAKKPSIYGKATDWPRIYKANKKIIGKNANLIYPGQKFVIPK